MTTTANTTILYSVIVPVYKSPTTLVALYERVAACFEQLKQNESMSAVTYELIFVEDGGGDDSWEVLTNLQKQYPQHITAIQLTHNFGQHNAIMCGLAKAKGQYLITIDDDLQTPPEAIAHLIAQQKASKAEVIYGIYPKKQHSVLRNWGSRFFKYWFNYGSAAHRDGSSFRLFSASIAKGLVKDDSFFVYIDNLLAQQTTNISICPVPHQERADGTSGYSLWKLGRLSMKILVHYGNLRIKTLLLAGFIGMLTAVFGMLMCIGQVGYLLLWGGVLLISFLVYSFGLAGFLTQKELQRSKHFPQYKIKIILHAN